MMESKKGYIPYDTKLNKPVSVGAMAVLIRTPYRDIIKQAYPFTVGDWIISITKRDCDIICMALNDRFREDERYQPRQASLVVTSEP